MSPRLQSWGSPGHPVKMADNESQQGFTLLEVLVALTILALALGAMVKAGGESARNLVDLREKTFATWVAENVITDALVLETWPDIGTTDGSEEMGGAEWYWRAEVSATGTPGGEDILRRIDVYVGLDQAREEHVAVLTAYRGKGQEQ